MFSSLRVCCSRRSLLRIGVLVRLCLLLLAATSSVLTRITVTDGAIQLATHYDATRQIEEETRREEACAHMGWQRGVTEAFGWMTHWDGRHTHTEEDEAVLAPVRPIGADSFLFRLPSLLALVHCLCHLGVHFLSLASTDGFPSFEKAAAFLPGMPIVIRTIANMIRKGAEYMQIDICEYTAILLANIILSNACYFLNLMLLYSLTLRVCKSTRFAYVTCVCFIFSPAGIFLCSLYTEGLFTCLALSGMIAREEARLALTSAGRALSLCMAAILFGLATLVRANGYMLIGFFVFDAIIEAANRIRQRQWPQSTSLLRSAGLATIGAAPFILLQFYLAHRFCRSNILPTSLPPYCDAFFPNVYAHVQSKYWHVGLFRYYTIQQIPNFIFAAPIWILSCCGIREYARSQTKRFFTIGIKQENNQTETNNATNNAGFMAERVLVYVYLWLALFIVCITVLHVQVSTRFLSFCPAVYWYAAHVMVRDPHRPAATPHRPIDSPVATGVAHRLSCTQRLLITWSCGFMIVGTVLFSTFLPWT